MRERERVIKRGEGEKRMGVKYTKSVRESKEKTEGMKDL
jgi:hypothetical protein